MKATIRELEDFLCRDCFHAAKRHALYIGPCADCWAEAKTICRKFSPMVDDEEAIDAIIARIEV